MRDDTIAAFLDQLAARVPAPGGGATAALDAAQAAALVAMVARYSDGPRYDAELMRRIVTEADVLRDEALALAEADADSFAKVAAAYRLPRETEQERSARSVSISSALAGAARPPADVVGTALLVVSLATELLPAANRSMITDVAAAAVAARAAAVTARLLIEVNLKGITDPVLRDKLAATGAAADTVAERADDIVASVRAEIAT
jgi:formiminotetrahydrofolate cyclodeaminase